MRGSTFSPPKPNQGDNLHPLHVSGENKLWLLHIPLPVTHKIAREREEQPQPTAESHPSPTHSCSLLCLWHLQPTDSTIQPSLWSCWRAKSPWHFNLSAKSNPSCYLSKNSHNLHQCKGSCWESLTQTLVHFLSLASLWFVGPTQTATLKYSVQPKEKRENSKSVQLPLQKNYFYYQWLKYFFLKEWACYSETLRRLQL